MRLGYRPTIKTGKLPYWVCPFESLEAVRKYAIYTKRIQACQVQWLTEKEARAMGYEAVGEQDPQYDGGPDWTQD